MCLYPNSYNVIYNLCYFIYFFFRVGVIAYLIVYIFFFIFSTRGVLLKKSIISDDDKFYGL